MKKDYLYKEIEDLVLNKKQKYFSIAYSIVLNAEDAKDALQEAYVSASLNIGKLRKKEYFETWFYRILINSCKKTIKKRSSFSISHNDYIGINDSDFANVEDKIYLEELLAILDIEHRQVLVLKYIEQLSIKEISEELEIPAGTVKSRLFYAIKKIQNKFEREGDCYEL